MQVTYNEDGVQHDESMVSHGHQGIITKQHQLLNMRHGPEMYHVPNPPSLCQMQKIRPRMLYCYCMQHVVLLLFWLSHCYPDMVFVQAQTHAHTPTFSHTHSQVQAHTCPLTHWRTGYTSVMASASPQQQQGSQPAARAVQRAPTHTQERHRHTYLDLPWGQQQQQRQQQWQKQRPQPGP